MSRPRSLLADEMPLDRALRDLAPLLLYPPTPDLAASVRQALERNGCQRHRLGWRPVRRGLALALIGLLLIAGAVLAVGIGLRGLSIVFVESPPGGMGTRLDLGEPLTLTQAQQRVAYRILLPTGARGEPDEVYLDRRRGLEQVALLYRQDDAVDLLITQFRATSELTPAVKEVGPGTHVEPVSVAGAPGYWIEGEPHVLRYRDPAGAEIDDRIRLVGDVLVWQRGEVTLRLEGASSRDAAIAIAESME